MSRTKLYRSVFVWLLCLAILQHTRGMATVIPQADDQPLIEPLARSEVIRFRLYSAYLDQEVPLLVYLPAGYENGETYPVWYGLHGYGSTENMWLMDAGIGGKADELMKGGEIRPLVMVFPQVRYDSIKEIQADMQDGVRGMSLSARFICEELVPYVDAHFQTVQSPQERFIGGFSMGGLLALEIGLCRPDLFGKVGAYSPALQYSDFSGGALTKWLYPTQAAAGADDLAGFRSAHGLERTRIYLDSGGVSDPFWQSIKALNESLQACGVSVEVHTHDGGHTLKQGLLRQYLLFYAGNP